jgi:hypothetical protein
MLPATPAFRFGLPDQVRSVQQQFRQRRRDIGNADIDGKRMDACVHACRDRGNLSGQPVCIGIGMRDERNEELRFQAGSPLSSRRFSRTENGIIPLFTPQWQKPG